MFSWISSCVSKVIASHPKGSSSDFSLVLLSELKLFLGGWEEKCLKNKVQSPLTQHFSVIYTSVAGTEFTLTIMAGPWLTSNVVEEVISVCACVCVWCFIVLPLLLCCAAAVIEGETRRDCDVYVSGHTSQHHHSTATGKCLCVICISASCVCVCLCAGICV